MSKRLYCNIEEPMTDNNIKKIKTDSSTQFSWLNDDHILCSGTTDDEYTIGSNQINCMVAENTLEKRLEAIENKINEKFVPINNKLDELYWKLETNTKEILLLLQDLKQQNINKKTNIQDAMPWMSYIN